MRHRGTLDPRPAHVLAHLDRVLCGQISGFVTCCVTLIARNGTTTMANAGHLPPYRNGSELEIPAGLPLDVRYGLQRTI